MRGAAVGMGARAGPRARAGARAAPATRRAAAARPAARTKGARARRVGARCTRADGGGGTAAPEGAEGESRRILSEEEQREVLIATTSQIKELGRKGKPKQAIESLAAMGREGVQPDVIAVTAVIEACCQSGEVELAVRVFRELFGARLAPDEVSFATLIRGYSTCGPDGGVDWRGINAIIRLMQQYEVPASTLTYTTLLQLCARTNDVERGMKIIEQMGREGVEVDGTTLMAVKNRRALRSHLKKTYANL